MTSLKIVIKRLNNSYESEPSSGIGSSLSEHHDSAIYDEENMNFPIYQIVHNEAITKHDDDAPHDKVNEEHDLKYKKLADSTPESSFEGFSDSSFEQRMEQREKDEEIHVEIMPPQLLVVPTALPEPPEPATITATAVTIEISPGKLRFAKFFDVITEENSCNAVDVPLSGEKAECQWTCVGSDHSNETSSELSFNGRIKRLTSESPGTSQQAPAMQQPLTIAAQRLPTLLERSMNGTDLMESSFVLKKYTNEKSPDLFGDDEDDDDNDEDGIDEHIGNNNEENKMNNLDNQCKETPKIFTYEEIIEEAMKKDEPEPLGDANPLTESNFVDEQTTEASSAYNQFSNSQNLFRTNCKRERELLRRTRRCLAGIPPPPTMTIPQIDVMAAVLSRKEDILNFHKTELRPEEPLDRGTDGCNTESLFKPTHTLEETQSMAWKDILGVRQHGLSFNLCKSSERNEYLSLSVIDRFVGSETGSSYQVHVTSAKKRSDRLKMLTASPGSRLSHLAKRRTVFSSANLANNLQKSTSSLGTQIQLDKKKIRNRRKATPKRKTPGSKKKNVRKTPSSSARKRLYRCDIIKPGPSRETSKRALFQSPAKRTQSRGYLPKPIVINPEIATRVEKSKRALFSVDKHASSFDTETSPQPSSFSSTNAASQQLESLLLKRKRNVCADYDDDVAELATAQHNKMFRGNGSQNLTPRALKIKSQSFCIGAGSSSTSQNNYQENTRNVTSEATLATSYSNNLVNSNQMLLQNRTSSSNSNSSIMTMGNCTLFRAQSENTTQIMAPNSLTENQRKKLLWAVSEALKEKKISAKHESFKEYASVLARVVRRIFQEYYQKGSTSNSETMLRLAKKYAYNVISNKNVDDIYFLAKAQIDEDKRKSSNRLAGYITSEEYENRKLSQQRQAQLSQTLSQRSFLGGGSLQNLFGIDNSMDSSFSMSISQASSMAPAASATFSGLIATQTSVIERTQEEQIKSMPTFDALLPRSKDVYQQQQEQLLKHPPIQPNPSLQNSSSKNNLCGLALRENVDCDQRRSAQKNFTGKDQRNVSPYAVVPSNRSALKTHSSVKHDLFGVNAAASKAKRHISFDS